MVTAAIYCRISEDRVGAGLGVARQRADCEALAAKKGWTVAGVYVDNDVSAYSGRRRPEYQRLLADLRAGTVTAVIVWHPDRLHRSPRELEEFIDIVEATGAGFATCTAGDIDLATSDGRLLARVVGSVARKESEDKSRRTRRKHVELAQAGKLSGGGRRPFGYDRDRVTIRPDEAAEIRAAVERILAGGSLRGVTHDWRTRGVRTVTGAEWSPTTVKRLLCSGRIAGEREHRVPGRPGQPRRVERSPAIWPAIITPDESARLRAQLGEHRVFYGNARTYLLTGFVVCGRCHIRLQARALATRGYRYRRYHCAKDRGGCDRVGISADRLEELIVAAVLARLDGPGLDRVLAAQATGSAEGDLIEEVRELEARLDDLARDRYERAVISDRQFLAVQAPLQRRLADARETLGRFRPPDVFAGVADGALREAWGDEERFPLDRKRAVLATVLDSIVVAPTTRAGNRFDPGRLMPPRGDIVWRV